MAIALKMTTLGASVSGSRDKRQGKIGKLAGFLPMNGMRINTHGSR